MVLYENNRSIKQERRKAEVSTKQIGKTAQNVLHSREKRYNYNATNGSYNDIKKKYVVG